MTTSTSLAVSSIERCLREASNACFGASSVHSDVALFDADEFEGRNTIAEYYIERAFIELMMLLEHLGLNETYRAVAGMLESARETSLIESRTGPGSPCLLWGERIRMYIDSVSSIRGVAGSTVSEIRDLKEIINRALPSICDTRLFATLPDSAADVHERLDAFLKCQFTDLTRTPAATRPLKNFQADSGIPSTRTLLSYKFVTSKEEARRVVEDIFALRKSSRAAEWKNLLFVVYQSHPVMPDEMWRTLLGQCELGNYLDVLVLTGDCSMPATTASPVQALHAQH